MLFCFDFKIRNAKTFAKLLLLYEYYCAFKSFSKFFLNTFIEKQNIEINIFVRFIFNFYFPI